MFCIHTHKDMVNSLLSRHRASLRLAAYLLVVTTVSLSFPSLCLMLRSLLLTCWLSLLYSCISAGKTCFMRLTQNILNYTFKIPSFGFGSGLIYEIRKSTLKIKCEHLREKHHLILGWSAFIERYLLS